MRKILITGGAGNVASSLCRKLGLDKKNEIVVADNLLTGSLHKVPLDLPNVRFVKCDVNKYSDIAAVFFNNHFDYVFHFAAVVGVQRTLDNPLLVFEDIKGIENILNLCKNTGVKRVYYSSSSEVYGEPFEVPQNESSTPLNSRLPYAIVKNLGESYCKAYHKEYNLQYTIFRFFNTYGPNQSEDFVIPRFIRSALNNTDITIYGDGLQTRTFIYIDDNLDVITKCLYDDLFVNDVINIGGADEMTILELAQTVIKVLGSSSKIVHLPALKEGDMRRRRPDLSKIAGIKSDYLPLEEGIRILAASMKNQPVRPVY